MAYTNTDDHGNPEGDTSLQLTGSIWLGSGTRNWGTQRRMALLQAIDEEGSISAGARKIGLSYKAAWDAVETMNSLAGETLVERTTGGQRGGGAILTPRACNIVALYRTLDQAHQRFVTQLASLAETGQPDLDIIRNLMVSTSFRNKLSATVSHIQRGKHMHDITLELANTASLVASLEHARYERLKPTPGAAVLAFIDASSIMIGLPGPAMQLSARNQLKGKVLTITTGAQGADVTIALGNGVELISQVTPASLERLSIAPGAQVQAIFKASSVVLGSGA